MCSCVQGRSFTDVPARQCKLFDGAVLLDCALLTLRHQYNELEGSVKNWHLPAGLHCEGVPSEYGAKKWCSTVCSCCKSTSSSNPRLTHDIIICTTARGTLHAHASASTCLLGEFPTLFFLRLQVQIKGSALTFPIDRRQIHIIVACQAHPCYDILCNQQRYTESGCRPQHALVGQIPAHVLPAVA